ncbi:putative Phosphatidylinositol N-acetylglucosaminyltransferase subunit C [Hypsibius exemplaris]|uniref:Phosphatidylinositol N-acetylglucosaminyltransferase subunit C n=1 Tax=Hypsibius exemplaris TaxID=2072580 RepID=A0A1W0WVJ4_HYPEX|nr:putative Phosphatidylinositol N-acetylglucosaminyltransferase subunit C [Hypsibius exemplaris]
MANSHPAAHSRRILWKSQGTPDNHTDDDVFLRELRTNVNLRTYRFSEAVTGSAVLIQQICLVIFFTTIYAFMLEGRLSAWEVITGFSVTLVALHLVYRSLTQDRLAPSRKELHTFLVIYGFAFGISPILSTLTKSVSTDTIYSMVAGMLLANLAVHDYGPRAMVVSQAFSLNAAFAAAVCLASRLSSPLDAFALIIAAAGIFGLWPPMRSAVKEKRPRHFVWIAPALVLADFLLIAVISRFFAVLFVLFLAGIGLLCPALFVYLQRYKTTIHGPWDEAVIAPFDPTSTTPPPVGGTDDGPTPL